MHAYLRHVHTVHAHTVHVHSVHAQALHTYIMHAHAIQAYEVNYMFCVRITSDMTTVAIGLKSCLTEVCPFNYYKFGTTAKVGMLL